MFTGWRNWFNAAGALLVGLTMSGTTAQRPTDGLWVGRPFFDTTLGYMVFWDGAAWISGAAFPEHNSLSGLQGGVATEYYHLTAAEYAALGDSINLLPEQATTSGTVVDFTIPSGAKRVTVMLDESSTNGNSNYAIQLGDAGGVEITGYIGSCALIAAVPASTPDTVRFLITQVTAAARLQSGCIILSLEDATNNTWTITGSINNADGVHVPAGRKSLSAELTTVRLTTVAPNTFDAGAVSASWE